MDVRRPENIPILKRKQNLRQQLDKTKQDMNLGQHFFSQRIVESWKTLPEDIVSSSTVLNFENFYDSFHYQHKFIF